LVHEHGYVLRSVGKHFVRQQFQTWRCELWSCVWPIGINVKIINY